MPLSEDSWIISSDLHLGKHESRKRADRKRDGIERMFDYAGKRTMLIAGDIMDDHADSDEIRKETAWFRKKLEKLDLMKQLIALVGNHDNQDHPLFEDMNLRMHYVDDDKYAGHGDAYEAVRWMPLLEELSARSLKGTDLIAAIEADDHLRKEKDRLKNKFDRASEWEEMLGSLGRIFGKIYYDFDSYRTSLRTLLAGLLLEDDYSVKAAAATARTAGVPVSIHGHTHTEGIHLRNDVVVLNAGTFMRKKPTFIELDTRMGIAAIMQIRKKKIVRNSEYDISGVLDGWREKDELAA